MINQSHYDLPTIVPSSFLKLTGLLYKLGILIVASAAIAYPASSVG